MASPVPPLELRDRRSPWVIVVLVAAVLLLGGIIGSSLYRGLSDDDGRPAAGVPRSTYSTPVCASDRPVQ